MAGCIKVLVLVVVVALLVVNTKARRVLTAEKAGSCPEPGIGLCVERCSGDSNCLGDLKCCYNGCGHTCESPVGIIPTEFRKPGSCPSVPRGHAGLCVESGSADDGCPGSKKCCSNGRGHTCQDPE